MLHIAFCTTVVHQPFVRLATSRPCLCHICFFNDRRSRSIEGVGKWQSVGIWVRCHPHTREFERGDDNEVNVAGGMH